MPDSDLEALQAVIIAHFPELARARFSLLTKGWHSVAVDVDDALIFKFPRDETAERALKTEAGLLTALRPRVSLPVPDLALVSGPPLFSRHAKLKGEHLVTADYERLPEAARRRLAEFLARFYAELHALERGRMEAAGARPIRLWLAPDDIWPLLPAELRPYAERVLASWRQLEPDPHGVIYGFFDGHGWNMAFDHHNQHLNGIYDFADSGLGMLHQEFVYSNFISADLTSRIITDYERITGKHLDRARIALLTAAHRLSELAEVADDPAHVPAMLKHVMDWTQTHCTASVRFFTQS